MSYTTRTHTHFKKLLQSSKMWQIFDERCQKREGLMSGERRGFRDGLTCRFKSQPMFMRLRPRQNV